MHAVKQAFDQGQETRHTLRPSLHHRRGDKEALTFRKGVRRVLKRNGRRRVFELHRFATRPAEIEKRRPPGVVFRGSGVVGVNPEVSSGAIRPHPRSPSKQDTGCGEREREGREHLLLRSLQSESGGYWRDVSVGDVKEILVST